MMMYRKLRMMIVLGPLVANCCSGRFRLSSYYQQNTSGQPNDRIRNFLYIIIRPDPLWLTI